MVQLEANTFTQMVYEWCITSGAVMTVAVFTPRR